jgi:hypothetical protein
MKRSALQNPDEAHKRAKQVKFSLTNLPSNIILNLSTFIPASDTLRFCVSNRDANVLLGIQARSNILFNISIPSSGMVAKNMYQLASIFVLFPKSDGVCLTADVSPSGYDNYDVFASMVQYASIMLTQSQTLTLQHAWITPFFGQGEGRGNVNIKHFTRLHAKLSLEKSAFGECGGCEHNICKCYDGIEDKITVHEKIASFPSYPTSPCFQPILMSNPMYAPQLESIDDF